MGLVLTNNSNVKNTEHVTFQRQLTSLAVLKIGSVYITIHMHDGGLHDGGLHDGRLHDVGLHDGGLHDGVLHDGVLHDAGLLEDQ
ncbi:hypothetical protein Btru_040232 [Bulinus truncatus]|nr:hypothetical protein Btru_040232 [Bulinus truncatus]